MSTVDLVGIRPLMQATPAALFKFEMFDSVGDEQQTTPARACFISTDQRAKLSSRADAIIADLSDRVQIFADGRLRVNLAHRCVVGINEVIE